MKRILGASALVLALGLTGAVASPAAAEPAKSVTLKGHVYDVDGDPISGIKVAAGFPGDTPANFYEETKTDKNGRYEITIRSGEMSMFWVNSWNSKWMPKSKDTFTAVAGKSYRINRTLIEQGEIAGTVRDSLGASVRGVNVIPYDAKTGKKLAFNLSNNGQSLQGGHYHMAIRPGTYKLRILDLATREAFWYGGVATKAESPAVSVDREGKTAGINVTLPYPSAD